MTLILFNFKKSPIDSPRIVGASTPASLRKILRFQRVTCRVVHFVDHRQSARSALDLSLRSTRQSARSALDLSLVLAHQCASTQVLGPSGARTPHCRFFVLGSTEKSILRENGTAHNGQKPNRLSFFVLLSFNFFFSGH